MKTTLILALAAIGLTMTGCARFSTTQKEIRNDTETTITTKVSAWTLFEASSQLAAFKAKQSEGDQSAEVGGLNQQAAAGTNVVAALESILKIVEAVK